MTHAIASPIIVATGDDCAFYRDVADARRGVLTAESKVFDGRGRRLIIGGDRVQIAPIADGAQELASLLRDWLGLMDALRESTVDWSLELLVRASVEHLGHG